MSNLQKTENMSQFCDHSKSDVEDVIQYADFFIDSNFISEVKPFSDNFEEFSRSIDDMKEWLESNDYEQKLKQHGLTNKEKTRKLRIYDTTREIYYKAKHEFVVALNKFWKEFYHKRNEKVDFDKAIDRFSKTLKKLYRYASEKLRKFRISKEKLLNIINIILKSTVNALGIGELATEFKDTLEHVTKTEKTPSLHITMKRLDKRKIERIIEEV